MPFWLLQPFPVPFPAPSFVGLLTAYALLCGMLIGVQWFFPSLRSALGFERWARHPFPWLLLGLGTSLVGLIIMSIWGRLTELPIGFTWSAVYMAIITALRFVLSLFVKKPPTNHRCL
jgi:quinol-cytochrome oxidoreductase complex cytochrome b subunit